MRPFSLHILFSFFLFFPVFLHQRGVAFLGLSKQACHAVRVIGRCFHSSFLKTRVLDPGPNVAHDIFSFRFISVQKGFNPATILVDFLQARVRLQSKAKQSKS